MGKIIHIVVRLYMRCRKYIVDVQSFKLFMNKLHIPTDLYKLCSFTDFNETFLVLSAYALSSNLTSSLVYLEINALLNYF